MKINQCVNGLTPSCLVATCATPTAGPTLADVQGAVIIADRESTQHHSSCSQTTECKVLQGDGGGGVALRHGSIKCTPKDKPTHYMEGMHYGIYYMRTVCGKLLYLLIFGLPCSCT